MTRSSVPVLVHIVECAPQKPDQTTAEWALEPSVKLAPEPPGPVLETGKYSGVKYAYVVTKPADETMVRAGSGGMNFRWRTRKRPRYTR